MGATKIKIKNIKEIKADELLVDDFELKSDQDCSYIIDHHVSLGEMVLIKASFKNACELDDEEQRDDVLYRRRVVPFITRVVEASRVPDKGHFRVAAMIENIAGEDRDFFFSKYFELGEGEEPLALELEGKHISFTMA